MLHCGRPPVVVTKEPLGPTAGGVGIERRYRSGLLCAPTRATVGRMVRSPLKSPAASVRPSGSASLPSAPRRPSTTSRNWRRQSVTRPSVDRTQREAATARWSPRRQIRTREAPRGQSSRLVASPPARLRASRESSMRRPERTTTGSAGRDRCSSTKAALSSVPLELALAARWTIALAGAGLRTLSRVPRCAAAGGSVAPFAALSVLVPSGRRDVTVCGTSRCDSRRAWSPRRPEG